MFTSFWIFSCYLAAIRMFHLSFAVYGLVDNYVHTIDTVVEAVPVNMSQATENTGLRVFNFAAKTSTNTVYVSTPSLISMIVVVRVQLDVAHVLSPLYHP